MGQKKITPSPYQGEGWGRVKPGDMTPTPNLALFPALYQKNGFKTPSF